jgi:hypothetical protein
VANSAWVAQLVPSKAATTLRVPDVAFLNRAFREDTILHLAHASNFTANFLVRVLMNTSYRTVYSKTLPSLVNPRSSIVVYYAHSRLIRDQPADVYCFVSPAKLSPSSLKPCQIIPRLPKSGDSVLPPAAMFIGLAACSIPYPGVQNDEVLFTAPIYPHAVNNIQPPAVPRLMLIGYIGTLKTLLYWPILWIFGPASGP